MRRSRPRSAGTRAISRRSLLAGLAGAAAAPVTGRAQTPGPGGPATATSESWLGVERHGLSTFGALKYGPDFTHFAYVNPAAPKGGRLSFIGSGAITTFDSFQLYILRGDKAQGLEYIHGSLLTTAYDEPDSYYCLIARSVEVARDRRTATFRLRPEARFSDGSQVTADDLVFTFDALKQNGAPAIRIAIRDIVRCEAVDPLTVRYHFTGARLRDLPLIAGGLPVLSRAYYRTEKFDQTTLKPPVGCGPYRIGAFEVGRYVTYVRRPDYWGWAHPAVRGHFNFDELRYEFFADRGAALQNLKAGTFDLREEFTSRDWATAYDIPAVRERRLLRLSQPSIAPAGAQGFYINTRREKFADKRVRRALDYAFNFEWTNRNLFFDLYQRTQSFFENTDLKAAGSPSPGELALLEPHRADLDPDALGEVYVPPATDGTGSDRRNLREAARLLDAAGFAFRNGQRINAAGLVLDIEFLSTDQTSDRILQPYISNLSLLGMNARIRRVDPAQYERRRKSFDFDIMSARLPISITPGNELLNLFSGSAATTEGSFNLAGIRNPAVDALIGKVTEASSREELRTACRALDRVLRAGHYWVPHWFKASRQIAVWDKFGMPPAVPRYDRGPVNPWWADTWWFDAEKAARLRDARK